MPIAELIDGQPVLAAQHPQRALGPRGRDLANATGTATARHAIGDSLTPQWRARVPASRRTARALGFRELGIQISLLLL